MADNLEDIAPFSLFPFEFNWQSTPSKYDVLRRLVVYPGTAQRLETFIDLVPIQFSGEIHLDGKQAIYDWYDWWSTYKGKVKKFWVKFYKANFTMIANAGIASTFYRVTWNNFHYTYQGHETVFLELTSGDTVTRKITSITENEPGGYYDLVVGTTDRDVDVADVLRFGRLLLVRFDSDRATLRFKNQNLATVEVSFREMLTEYNEVT